MCRVCSFDGCSPVLQSLHLQPCSCVQAYCEAAADYEMQRMGRSRCLLHPGCTYDFLKIHEKSNYNTIKWVRYISKNGQYLNRI